MNKVRGFLIDVEKSNPYIAEVDGSLESYYTILNCDTFDIASRKIGEHIYDIYCDDEGLLKDHPLVSAISSDRHPMLVGNLFITKTDEEGNTISLTDEEIDEVKRHLTPIFDDSGKYYPCLICDYY